MVGLNVQEPETTCDDPNCPFHGTLPVRGQVLEGVVVSNKAERTITVERSYYKFIRKYFVINVNEGDSVKKGELLALVKLSGIREAGYQTVTPVVVTNSDEFSHIKMIKNGKVTCKNAVLEIK